MTPKRSLLLSAILVALSSSLTACGGGGGGSNVKADPPPPVVVTPPGTGTPDPNPPSEPSPPDTGTPDPNPPGETSPPDTGTPEPTPPKEDPAPPAPVPEPPVVVNPPVVTPPYNPNDPLPAPGPLYRPHLDYTHAADAHAQGYTGKGIKIGIIDSGVNIYHPALQGKVVAEFTATTGDNTAQNDPFGHGTNVAQIIAGDHIGRFQGGIAYDADLYITRSLDGSGYVAGIVDSLAWMNSQNVSIVNNSWNLPLYLEDMSAGYFQPEFIDEARALVNRNGLVVFANGNDWKEQPGMYSRAPEAFSELEAGWLTVGALRESSVSTGKELGSTDELALYSNQCGNAKNWCLVAPGTIVVQLPSYEGNQPYYNHTSATGTSFAAPQVSAAAALVWQAYPWMTNNQVRKTILGTARDIGAPGVDEVFGYGVLNTGKAVNGFGSLEWGTETFNVTAGSYDFSNAITGSGGIIKDGVGTLFLSNDNSFAGDVTVQGGTLGLTGSVASNVLTTEDGHLLLTGHIGGNLTNEGRTTSKGGHVAGDWAQGHHSTLEAVLGAPSLVDGKFSADGTLSVVGTASADYIVQQTETVLKADEVTGTFAQTEFAAGLFMTGTTRYTANSVELDVIQTAPTSLAFMVATPQSAANAQQLEQAFAVGERLQTVSTSTPAAAQGAFLAGLAQAQRVSTQAEALAVANTLSGQGRALAASALLANQQAQDATAFNRLGTASLTEAGAFATVGRTETHFSPSGWASTRLQSNDTSGGMDWDVGSARLGVTGQSSRGDLSMGDGLGHYRLNAASLGLYGRYALNDGWALLGQVRAGRGKLDGDRTVALGPQAGQVSHLQRYDQWSTALRVEKAWEGTAGTWVAYAGVSHYSQSQKASEDRGNTGFEQGTLEQTFASTGTQVGGQFASMKRAVGSWGFSWSAGVEYAHRHDHNRLALTNYFLVDPTTQGRLDGVEVGQNAWRGFAQARWNRGKVSAFVRGDVLEGSDMDAWGLETGVKLAW